MATDFKYIPRYADNTEKRENIVGFINSLEISKKYDKNTKRDRIVNIPEYFLFSNIYNSCSEIIRNESVLADRNAKARVHTLVTTSSLSDDLAFVASNIDGVAEALRMKVTAFGNESDFESLKKAVDTWEKTNKEITSVVEQLRNIVETNLEQGYGSPRQLRAYENKKVDENAESIKKLFFIDGKTEQEIAEQFGVRTGLVQVAIQDLTDEYLLENIETIKEKLAQNTPRADIAKDLKVSKKKLAAFITDKKLVDEAVKTKQQDEVKTKAPIKKIADNKEEKTPVDKPAAKKTTTKTEK